MNLFEDRKTLTLSIVCVLCIAVIILGSFATYDLVCEFTTKSESYGKPIIQHLAGDEYDLVLNEDESIFFAYTVSNLSFSENSTRTEWTAINSLEKLNYRPDECDYTLYINGRKIHADKMTKIINCPVSLNFRNPDDSVTTVEFELRVIFYTERTDIRITFTSDRRIGFINQMVNTGFNIRMIEKPVADKFENAGNVDNPSLPKNTYIYDFNPARLQWDGEVNHLSIAPYYVYRADRHTYQQGFVSPYATLSGENDTFCGVVYHDGFTVSGSYPDKTSDITYAIPRLEINGLIKGGNYMACITFADGTYKSAVLSYTSNNILTGLPGFQSKNESTAYHRFPNYEEYPNEEYSWRPETDGTFEHTIDTQYGKFDVLINPCFATKDGSLWLFTCGIYLKNPLSTISDSSTVSVVVDAIKTQLAFTLTINY